ncbi:MAG: RNA polymerase sigma factor SigZ [bacterium]|nr:RNA polymerase sigma factor SigZ [bacterium]
MTEIWNKFNKQLYYFILKNVKNEDLAKDLLMDAFIKIQTNISKLKDEMKLYSWIFQLTRNVIVDYYRKNKKTEKEPEELNVNDEREENSAMNSIKEWIHDYIETLPDKYKDVILLSEIEGLSLKQVSEKLGISYANTKVRALRGRKLLKADLEKCCTFMVDKYGRVLDYYKKKP